MPANAMYQVPASVRNALSGPEPMMGMDPNVNRLALLPRYSKADGLVAPQWIYDMARAVEAPGNALMGSGTNEDAFNFGLSFVGAGAGSRLAVPSMPGEIGTATIPGMALPKDLLRKLAESTRFVDRNPKKYANALVRANEIPESLRGETAAQLEQIRATRKARAQNAPLRVDPLERQARNRPEQAKALRNERSFLSSPAVESWASNRRDKVAALVASGDFEGATSEANLATLEALTREARRRGLTIRHTSTGRSGRVNSRYIELPDGREVRLSDHEIPMTEERMYNRSNFGGPSWSKEIVVNHSDKLSIDDYFNRIFGEE